MKVRGAYPVKRPAKKGRIFPLLLICLAAGGCETEIMPGSDVVARIGEQEVSYERFESYLDENVGQQADLAAPLLSELFDRFLGEEVLLARAIEEAHVAHFASRREATQALLERHPPPAVTEEEVLGYYEAHRSEFERPERVRLRQILTAEKTDAEKAQAALRSGADFADVARRLSQDPSAPYGGDQGELSRADLPPSFVEAVFDLQPGQTSPIVTADYGFHIFQVVSRKPSEVVSLEAARDEIRRQIQRRRADEQIERLLLEARQRYNVEVYDRNLPFDYQGSYRVAKQ